MRVHDSWAQIVEVRPDVAVLSECARPEILFRRVDASSVRAAFWTGPSSHKGLAVLFFGRTRGEARGRGDGLIAVELIRPRRLRLAAVWLTRGSGPLSGAGEVLGAPGPAVLVGDFNSALVRRRGRRAVPSRAARRLLELGFVSAYHASRGVELGSEPEPTLFLNRDPTQGRHVDYCLLRGVAVASVEVGAREVWGSASDHVPLIVDLAGARE